MFEPTTGAVNDICCIIAASMVSTIPKERVRRRTIGAEVLAGGSVHFRVWAPRRSRVEVVIEDSDRQDATVVELQSEGSGYFSGETDAAAVDSLYRFRLDGNEQTYPDPASRFQPRGPHGPSQVVDPRAFEWTDEEWAGATLRGQIIYEMHVGTFTREGTWESAANHLEEIADLGGTLLEIMPIADFSGRFGWGYDGVNPFAPTRLYGVPDDFRRFVDRAHSLGIGVILDVVYNHFGPDGNYLREFSEAYFTDRHVTDWGDPVNFDGEDSAPVREFFLENAAYWIEEFHVDGLRLDATDNIYDSSDEHILAAISRRARETAGRREIVLIGENEAQKIRLMLPIEQGGYGLDALWNDDFHHSAIVAVTGRNEAYYTDYLGKPQEFISAIKYGYLYQGQWYSWQKNPRGTPDLKLNPAKFVNFIQNHDQLANTAHGKRLHELTSAGHFRAITALLLLAPGTPMLFQGQEFAASSPFLYFADHDEELASQVSAGRLEFLSQFPSLSNPETQPFISDPSDPATFFRSKLDFSERQRNRETYDLHKDLISLRREDEVFRLQGAGGVDGAVLGNQTFVLRFFHEDHEDRLLLVNLGADHGLSPAPEPLLAPPAGKNWEILWSSEDPRYGGIGTPQLDTSDNWRVPGHSLLVLKPV